MVYHLVEEGYGLVHQHELIHGGDCRLYIISIAYYFVYLFIRAHIGVVKEF